MLPARVVLAVFSCVTLLAALLTGADDKKSEPKRAERYRGIPDGFDYPAERKTLEKLRDAGDVAALRKHIWMVFAGMTQPAPGGEAVWETWYAQEEETFAQGKAQSRRDRLDDIGLVSALFAPLEPPAPPKRANLGSARRKFHQPEQLKDPAGRAIGDSMLSFVLFNEEAHRHIRNNNYHQRKELNRLNKEYGEKGGAGDRSILAFPRRSVILKAVWWHVKQDGLTALPVWDNEPTKPITQANPLKTWKRFVAIDPTGVRAAAEAEVTFMGVKKKSRIVPLSKFYHFAVTEEQLPSLKETLGAEAKVGDYAVLIALHVTTKEIPDWVWATLWWHDRPNDGPFAKDRPDKVAGVWRHFLMDVAYSMETPKEPDDKPKICFNPYLENFANGPVSNCMACHQRALWPKGVSFLPITRGGAAASDPIFKNRLKLDFMWSINMLSR